MMRIFSKKPKEIINVTLSRQNTKNFVIFQIRFYNHYETLGVKPSATQKDIKTAFIKLSKKLHPDVNKQDPKAHEKFIAVNNAYGVLGKPNTREQYDLKSGIAYRSRPSSRPQHHYPRYKNSGYYEEELYRSHNSFFSRLKGKHRLWLRLHFSFRVIGSIMCILLGMLQWTADVERKKMKKKTVSSD